MYFFAEYKKWMDFAELDSELKNELARINGEAIVFMHQNIDPAIHVSHRLCNDSAVRSVLEESGKVKLVIQGHYHPGNENTVNGIRYLTLPAMCERQTDKAVCIIEI